MSRKLNNKKDNQQGFIIDSKRMPSAHVFIIGSKGIPAQYGGFETFVDKLTEYSSDNQIKYYVSCLVGQGTHETKYYTHNNAHCFPISVPNCGPAKAILYDVISLDYCVNYIWRNKIDNAVVLICACRIGPFLPLYKYRLKNLGVTLIVNPDGHEWKRAKWNAAIKKYWKFSERLMIEYADIIACDSIGIEDYVKTEYAKYKPRTVFIPYGAVVSERSVAGWLAEHGLKPQGYYLIVARFEPENNFETMIREFMLSKTEKPLIIITNTNLKFYVRLQNKLHFEQDPRIRFVGTVYDQNLLTSIRQNAFAYIHGHEVGGTNPSLLEALSCTDLNFLLNCKFNCEVGSDAALYWNKEYASLSMLMADTEQVDEDQLRRYGDKARQRIRLYYSWNSVVERYEKLFLGMR